MQRIVIVGGGFAGVKCARVLQKQVRGTAEVVLFSRDNHMVFQPLLPDVAGSSLNPRAVAPPLRLLLPRIRCRTETVLEIDAAANEIVHEGHDGTPRRLRYDHLVVACGNVVNLNGLPGMADHALPLKTIGDAIAMRAHVMRQLEKADLADTPEQRAFYLTFIVVGGGFSGVEIAGELNDLLRHSLKHYPNVRADDVMVTLLHGQAEILPELTPALRRFAQQRMAGRGIKLMCEVKAAEVTKRGVLLTNGRKVEGATVICTVGTAPNPLVAALDAPKERGRLATEPDMRVPGHANLWAVGDCAIVPNAYDGKAGPPTAQFAEREGCQCAKNIARVLRGEATLPFHHKSFGMACGIGGRRGVAGRPGTAGRPRPRRAVAAAGAGHGAGRVAAPGGDDLARPPQRRTRSLRAGAGGLCSRPRRDGARGARRLARHGGCHRQRRGALHRGAAGGAAAGRRAGASRCGLRLRGLAGRSAARAVAGRGVRRAAIGRSCMNRVVARAAWAWSRRATAARHSSGLGI